MEGNYVLGRELEEEALALSRQAGDPWGIAVCLEMLASLAYNEGRYMQAYSLGEESAAFSRLVGDNWALADALWISAVALLSQGNLERSQPLFEESLALCRETKNKRGVAYALCMLGITAFSQRAYARGHRLCEESLILSREVGDRRAVVWSLYGLGLAAVGQSEYAAAQTFFEECLRLLMTLSYTYKSFIALSLEGLVYTALAQGKFVWATRLWGAAELVREEGPALPPIARKLYEQPLADARRQLGEETFYAAWAEGRTITLEQVLAAQRPAMMPTQVPTLQRTTTGMLPPTNPVGLTTREIEVLRLLATGLRSAQIAEQLLISVLTVNGHIRSIYSKLGVTSRSAATRYAIEHELV